MNSDDILVIRLNIVLKPDKFKELHDQILKQRETGVILIPSYCTPIIVPKNTDIRVEKTNARNCINCVEYATPMSNEPCAHCHDQSEWRARTDFGDRTNG